MEVFVKVWSKDNFVGFLQFPDEETLSDNTEFFDEMFDSGFRIEKTTKKEYDDYQGGDELTIEDIKNGDYRIDDID